MSNVTSPPEADPVVIAKIINEALDSVCQENNLREQDLAARYDVDRSTVWRWRKGDIGKAAAILIPLILSRYTPLESPQVTAH